MIAFAGESAVLDLVESVGSERLRLAWDPANFVQCGVRPFSQGYRQLRPYLAYIQVKDAELGSGCPALSDRDGATGARRQIEPFRHCRDLSGCARTCPLSKWRGDKFAEGERGVRLSYIEGHKVSTFNLLY